MKTNSAILLFFATTLAIIVANAGLNYFVDAQCYYRCDEISLDSRTTNTYYQAAQRVLAHPDSQVLIVGSSRGETLIPSTVEKLTGSPVINLSVSGADLTTRRALIHFAIERMPINTVIWFADYFELIESTQDSKMRKTPSLRKLISSSDNTSSLFQDKLEMLQELFDHNTTSATMHFLKKPPPAKLTRGGSDIPKGQTCESEDFKGSETPRSLETKVNILYQSYVNGVLRPQQSPASFEAFQEELQSLSQKNIKVILVVIPYHPDFLERLKKEYPELHARHKKWVEQLSQLQIPQLEVLNFFDGIDHTDSSPKYWNDGVHFTCHSALKMVRSSNLLGRSQQ